MDETQLSLRLRRLRVMAFDVDGVLTDGRLWYTEDGGEMKAFDARDGHGMKMLRDGGLKIAIITSRRSAIVERRARELGVHYCFQGVPAKLPAFNELLGELGETAECAGFMGDDLLDLPVLTSAGLAATVPDAPASVRERAHWVSSRPGGRGAVRELCELILSAQGQLERLTARYLE